MFKASDKRMKGMKTICFVLTSFSRYPVGGYKMVFEYANRLSQMGYNVKIFFSNASAMKQFHLPEFIRKMLVNYLTQRHPRWFKVDARIEKISGCEKGCEDKLNDIDVVFATAALSVKTAVKIKATDKKVYFIQDYETWQVSKDYLHSTYGLGMTNVVIADWLKQIVDQYSVMPAVVIPNPIDVKIYRPIIPNKVRPIHSVAFLYHQSEHKGVKYVVEAVRGLRSVYPDIKVKCFGMYKRPNDLPEWIEYTEKASQEKTVEIYNSVQVFACATIEEGYGLTGLEAMACGTALATTKYKGVLEYADETNSLFSPVKDSVALMENIKRLFDDEDLRVKLSDAGVITAQKFSWDQAVHKLSEVIEA